MSVVRCVTWLQDVSRDLDARSVSLTKKLTHSEPEQHKDGFMKLPGFISVMSQVIQFTPRYVIHSADYFLAMCVRPSACPSVCMSHTYYSIETAKHVVRCFIFTVGCHTILVFSQPSIYICHEHDVCRL